MWTLPDVRGNREVGRKIRSLTAGRNRSHGLNPWLPFLCLFSQPAVFSEINRSFLDFWAPLRLHNSCFSLDLRCLQQASESLPKTKLSSGDLGFGGRSLPESPSGVISRKCSGWPWTSPDPFFCRVPFGSVPRFNGVLPGCFYKDMLRNVL